MTVFKQHPRPWKVIPDPDDNERCWGIEDAEGNTIVETDCGFYSPTREVAEFIVKLVNDYKENL